MSHCINITRAFVNNITRDAMTLSNLLRQDRISHRTMTAFNDFRVLYSLSFDASFVLYI
jgi:hypothetical protein